MSDTIEALGSLLGLEIVVVPDWHICFIGAPQGCVICARGKAYVRASEWPTISTALKALYESLNPQPGTNHADL